MTEHNNRILTIHGQADMAMEPRGRGDIVPTAVSAPDEPFGHRRRDLRTDYMRNSDMPGWQQTDETLLRRPMPDDIVHRSMYQGASGNAPWDCRLTPHNAATQHAWATTCQAQQQTGAATQQANAMTIHYNAANQRNTGYDLQTTTVGVNTPVSKKHAKASIKIATLNINGGNIISSRQKWYDLNRVVLENKISILALTEAHIDEGAKTSLNNLFARQLSFHVTSDPINPTSRGGVAVILNKQYVKWKSVKEQVIIPGRALYVTIDWAPNPF